jgi:hypothetical protein
MSDKLEEINLNLKTEVVELCEANINEDKLGAFDEKEYIEKCIIAISNEWKNYSYNDCKEYIKSDVDLYLQMRDYLKWKRKEEINGVYEVVNMYMFTFRNEYLMGASKMIFMKHQINKYMLPS